MVEVDLVIRIFFAIAFGAILGLETETRGTAESGDLTEEQRDQMQSERIGGVRTYTVLTLFGAVTAIFFNAGYEMFAYMGFVAIFAIVLAAYVLNIKLQKAFGMTTEIAIMISYLVGFAAVSEIIPLTVLIALVFVVAFVLSQKRGIAKLTRKVAHSELQDVIKFGIIALVVLPLLPNQDILVGDVFDLSDLVTSFGGDAQQFQELVLLNPFRLWQYVILISGFSLLGYFANKSLGGAKGVILTGAFGGLISSTSTVATFAITSLNTVIGFGRQLAAAALIANAISFPQIIALALTTNAGTDFNTKLIAVALALAGGSMIAAIMMLRSTKADLHELNINEKPFSLGPAIQFAVMLTVFRLIIQIVQVSVGESGSVLAIALAGVTGMDIATISIGELVASGQIEVSLALGAFFAANLVNYLAKSFYSVSQGSKIYYRHVVFGLLCSLLIGLVATAALLL